MKYYGRLLDSPNAPGDHISYLNGKSPVTFPLNTKKKKVTHHVFFTKLLKKYKQILLS